MTSTRNSYESRLHGIAPWLPPTDQPVTTLFLLNLLNGAGTLAPARIMAAWPALKQRQRELAADISPFFDVTVLDTLESIRRLIPKHVAKKEAIPPSMDDIYFLWAVVDDMIPSARAYRSTAFIALVQFYSLQRASSILAIKPCSLKPSVDNQIVIMHTHKTQKSSLSLVTKSIAKEPVPSEPFEGMRLYHTMQQGLAVGWLNRTGRLGQDSKGGHVTYSTYSKDLYHLWLLHDIPTELACFMTSHGLRRAGFHYYYYLWGRSGLDKILRLGHWKSLKNAKEYLPAELQAIYK